MKCLLASSGCPGPNSSSAKDSPRNCAPLPVVPCRISTAGAPGRPSVRTCSRSSGSVSPEVKRKSRATKSASLTAKAAISKTTMGAACHGLLLCAPVPRIHLLDATLANQIAAGEVIERPAAVVKELVENALDAGAKRIDAEIHDGGRRLIRVRDDGSGMGREDAALSVQRHATSKLRSKDDLFAIASYGFRGEALPSMAAVSRFSLVTCEAGALKGTRIEVEGSASPVISDAGAPPGTTVEVRDLFWNVPARRKFLKKGQTEQAPCVDAVLRLALPRPDVTFMVREGDRTLTLLQSGTDVLPSRAEEALGREVRGQLVPFSGECRSARAHGLLVSPAVEYGSARNVWLFVNVHPAKAEVRFADPRSAWDAIYGGLTQVLARGDWMPQRTGTDPTAAADPT